MLTGSHGIGSDGLCVCVYVCEFSQTMKPHRDGCQSGRGLTGVGLRDEGMEDRRLETSGWG